MVSFDITAKFKQNKQRFLFAVILNQTQSQLNFVNVSNHNVQIYWMGESWRKIRLILTADAMFLYQPYFVSQKLFQLPSNWLCSWFELATLIEQKIARHMSDTCIIET